MFTLNTNSPSPRQQLAQQPSKSKENNTHMLDLLDVNLSPVDSVPTSSSPSLGATAAPAPHLDPWGIPIPPPRPQPQQMDPWSVSTASSVSDPWSPVPAQPPLPKSVAPNDPWKTVSPPPPARPNDPWSPATEPSPASLASPISNTDLDDFDIITNRDRHSSNNVNNNKNGTVSPNPFDMSGLEDSMNGGLGNTGIGVKRSPQSFLGENSALVNLDNLVTKPLPPPPHLATAVAPPLPTTKANPFSPVTGLQPARQAYPPPSQGLPQPLVPQPANPFLS